MAGHATSRLTTTSMMTTYAVSRRGEKMPWNCLPYLATRNATAMSATAPSVTISGSSFSGGHCTQPRVPSLKYPLTHLEHSRPVYAGAHAENGPPTHAVAGMHVSKLSYWPLRTSAQ